MIRNIQITGEEDTHPEKPIHDAGELASGRIDMSSLPIKRHQTAVFDLMDKDQRAEYDALYSTLMYDARKGSTVIISNVRETLTRADRSTGWFRYIEWIEFDTSEILGA